MVGGGVAAALLAIQIASRTNEQEQQEETQYRPYEMPCNSLTGTVSTCMTAQPFVSLTGGKYER